jgi:aminoglycoside 2'-N-acetyltransferase I
MAELQLAHTAFLGHRILTLARTFLAEQFAGEFTNYDWENALGGIHALLWEEGELIGHASVIQRRLLHREKALRAGFYECVVVHSERRGCGHGTMLMKALAAKLDDVHEISALCSGTAAKNFYKKLGWTAWRGPLGTLTPEGVREDPRFCGRVLVREHSFPLDIDGSLVCDWRDGDPWD